MRPISIRTSAEKGSATVTVGEEFTVSLTTEEVDGLLLRLVETRPVLLPQPTLEPEPPQPFPLVAIGHRYYVHPNFQQGGVFLHLPHPAAGWVTWHIPADICRGLIQTLQEYRVPQPPVQPTPTPG